MPPTSSPPAPLSPSSVIRAKIEVVLISIGVVCLPLIAALAFVAPLQAVVTTVGIVAGATSATAIQFWFRVQAKRSQFRRRQTSSRLATFAEAFFLDRMGRDRRAGLGDPRRRRHLWPDDRGAGRHDLEAQPATGVM